MPINSLDEREFELINILGSRIVSSQRELSRRMNLSVGTINLLIHRLISKGHIRIRQLNKRKVEYLLTPKGFSEKMYKSIKYTAKTLRSLGVVRERLAEILSEFLQMGDSDFYVVGNEDISALVGMVLRELSHGNYSLSVSKTLPSNVVNSTILYCSENPVGSIPACRRFVNVLEELARDKTPAVTEH